MKPLGSDIDGGMRILRWYGVEIPRDETCTECGDFAGETAREHGFTVAEEDLRIFEGDRKDV
jgi:hypothetical protein